MGFSPCKITCFTSLDLEAEELGAESRNTVALKQTAALFVSEWKRSISEVFGTCCFLDTAEPCANDPTLCNATQALQRTTETETGEQQCQELACSV